MRDTLDEIKQKSVRMKRSRDGEEKPVSKLTERNQEEKENKQNARRAAYAATTTENGIYLCSGCQLNIDDATNRMTQVDMQ